METQIKENLQDAEATLEGVKDTIGQKRIEDKKLLEDVKYHFQYQFTSSKISHPPFDPFWSKPFLFDQLCQNHFSVLFLISGRADGLFARRVRGVGSPPG